ncbi:polysaccharide biosynthesis/export family protein [Pseudomonas sp. CGJS7]|uniref:polysaccharide biosynthesis/export family protein n=1 Tax=Pseudomonas sp. CGJS7 TaxID=3109348 RepID=UPI00300A4C8B
MSKISRALAVAAIVGLTGCMLAPGQYISPSQFVRSGVADDGHIQMVSITPQYLAGEHRSVTTVPAELMAYQPEAYRIGRGDTLYITIWDHPELTSPAGTQQQAAANGRLVRPDGTLFYPYVGVVRAEGLTIEELRTLLTDKISRFVESPQVDLSIIEYGSQRVTLQGAFVKTERQSITAVPLTLAQAIGAATVDPIRADLAGFVLTRGGRQYRLDLDGLNRGESVANDIYLKAGDHLYMPYNDRKEVYVVGEVVRPQALTFKTTDMSLTQALGRAGGLNPLTAKGEAVYVIRGVEDMKKQPATVFHLNAKSPASYALASQFSVQAGDVVFVGPAGVTRWNRFVNQLLPFSNIINNAANTDNLLDK